MAKHKYPFRSEKEALQMIQKQAETLAKAVAAAEAWHGRCIAEIEQSLQQQLDTIQSRYEETLGHLEQKHEADIRSVMDELESLYQSASLWAEDWQSPVWQSYTPDPLASPPAFTRLGMLRLQGPCHWVQTPALLPILGGKNLLIKATGGAMTQATMAVQSLLLRLLVTTAPGKLRFLLFDPAGLGQNVAGFMHLHRYDEALVTSWTWTEARDIAQRLADITLHLENVFQKYLVNRYPTIEDYNREAGEVAEPYRIVATIQFPVNFSEDAARRLVSIATNGPHCGVYTVTVVNTNQPLPYGFQLADLERTANVISWDGQRFVWEDDDFRDVSITLDAPPPASEFERLVRLVGVGAQEGSKVEVPFSQVAPGREAWWHGTTAYELRGAIGLMGVNIQEFILGAGLLHSVLIAGRPRSGKSNLMHVLITSLALAYPPEELQLYLVDFKEGVEFKRYATHCLSHARVVAIETEREFGLSVLSGLDDEFRHRGELFRAAQANVLASYRQTTGRTLPRILLVVDEFHEFFTEDDALAQKAAIILDRLVRQGPAFGINVLLGSQTLAGAYSGYALSQSTMDQMAVRIALQCSEADSRLILAEDNLAARLLSRPGEAIYNTANGLVEGNNVFQVAWLPDEEQETYLREITKLAQDSDRRYPPPIVFEGNKPANLEECQPLQKLLDAPDWPVAGQTVDAYIGEPVAIHPSVAARFRRQGGCNLIVLGRDEEAAVGMLTAAVLSLAAQRRPGEARFDIIDLSTTESTWADVPEQLAAALPHQVRVLGRRDVPDLIGEIAHEVQRRQESGPPVGPVIYLLVIGLQRTRDLREDQMYSTSYDDPPPNPTQQFADILEAGPEVGVHVLTWCDTYASLSRALDRRSIGNFTLRVALPMSEGDSQQFLDSPAAARLGRANRSMHINRAIFADEGKVGHLIKLRPYAVPPAKLLAEIGQRLRERIKP